jgi:predicted nucleic acid-binding protein
VIALDEAIAKEAAKISVSYEIPAIDSMVAATSKLLECDRLLSDDSHLKKLDGKKYIKIESWLP